MPIIESSINNVQRTAQNVKISDKFYNLEFVLQPQEFETVFSFFKKRMEDPVTAERYAVNIFKIAHQQGVSALDLIRSLEFEDEVGITAAMCYHLNQFRSQSTLFGVGNLFTPDYYAFRNVLI